MADRLHPRVRRPPRVQVQRVLLGLLRPSALADSVPAGVALRDEVGYAGRLGRGQQVVRPLGAQPVGGGEPPIDVLDIGLAGVRHGNCGHLAHDRVRPGLGHRLTDRHRIQPVHHDRLGAQLRQQAQLGRARRRSRHLWWPRATSCGTSRLQMTPVPPATNTRMTITSLIPESVSET